MTDSNRPVPLVSTVLVIGFGTALALWVLWWVTHLPGLALPRGVTIPLMMVVTIAGVGHWTARGDRSIAIRAGVLGGLLCGVLNLMLLGSEVVDQPEGMAPAESGELRSDAILIVAGFLLVNAVLGLLGGLLGRAAHLAKTPPTAADQLARLATIGAVSFLPLLVAGGAVTSTESGMAVTDPIVSFLMPFSLMAGESRIFFEHSHRLFGTLVGLAMIAVAIGTIRIDRRLWAKALGVVVLALVIVQGVLGALRVGENSVGLAIGHGIFGQIVFSLAVVLASVLSGPFLAPVDDLDGETLRACRRGKTVSLLLIVAVLIQLAFGALSRHTGSSHPLWAHAGFSLFVVGLAHICGSILRGASGTHPLGRTLRRTGLGLVVVVSAQFVLGFLALWQVGMSGQADEIPLEAELAEAPPIDVLEAVITTGHQAIGAGILGLCVLAAAWVRRVTGVSVAG